MNSDEVQEILQEINHLHLDTGNRWLGKPYITTNCSANSDDLRILNDRGYLNHNNNRYKVSKDGSQYIRDQEMISELQESKQVNRILIRQSKISSAAETIFTYALLTFSYIQVLNGNYGVGPILATSIYATAIILSSIIGFSTLIEVFKDRIIRFREWRMTN